MDRFIDAKWLKTKAYDKLFKIQYGQIYRILLALARISFSSLKSNMDRFIVKGRLQSRTYQARLKSNMDRFIENEEKNYKTPDSI